MDGIGGFFMFDVLMTLALVSNKGFTTRAWKRMMSVNLSLMKKMN